MGNRTYFDDIPVTIDFDGIGGARALLGVTFAVRPARPASRTEPAEPAEVDVLRITMSRDGHRTACPDWLADALTSGAGFDAAMLECAAYDDRAREDDAADARREEMRERA